MSQQQTTQRSGGGLCQAAGSGWTGGTTSLSAFLLRCFPYLDSAHQVFNLHVLRCWSSSIFTPFSFMSFLITSLHLSLCRPMFWCPPTSIFRVLIELHLLHSFSPRGLTISVSLILCLPHMPLLLFLHS